LQRVGAVFGARSGADEAAADEAAADEAAAEEALAAALATVAVAPSALSCATIFYVRLAEASPLGTPPWITDSWQRLLGPKSDLHSKLVRMPYVIVVE